MAFFRTRSSRARNVRFDVYSHFRAHPTMYVQQEYCMYVQQYYCIPSSDTRRRQLAAAAPDGDNLGGSGSVLVFHGSKAAPDNAERCSCPVPALWRVVPILPSVPGGLVRGPVAVLWSNTSR